MDILIDTHLIEGYARLLTDVQTRAEQLTTRLDALSTEHLRRELLDTAAACQYLSVSEDSLLYYRTRKGLPYLKKGTLTLYVRGEIDDWLRAGHVNRHQK